MSEREGMEKGEQRNRPFLSEEYPFLSEAKHYVGGSISNSFPVIGKPNGVQCVIMKTQLQSTFWWFLKAYG